MKRFVAICLLLVCPSRALAQQDPPAVEVRGAFGISNYLHGDITYTAPTWIAAVRFGRGALAIEGEFASAAQEERETFGSAPGTSTPIVAVSTDRYRSVGVNLLGRWGDRVSGYAGGGPGVFWEKSDYELQAPDGFAQSSTRGPRPGAQLVAGLDIPVAPRVKLFGQFRYEVRSFDDPGGGSVVQGFGGVAIAIR